MLMCSEGVGDWGRCVSLLLIAGTDEPKALFLLLIFDFSFYSHLLGTPLRIRDINASFVARRCA